MSKFFLKEIKKAGKLKNPVLIEGLPGIGNVARIAVDYLTDKLKAVKYVEIYSYAFPNSVFINEDSTIVLPKIEIFIAKTKKRDLVLLVGDIQPIKEEESYLLCEEIIKLCKKLKISEVITLGGIGLAKTSNNPSVYGAVSDKKFIPVFRKAGVKFDGNKTVGLIIGAAGLILGLGRMEGINGTALLGETVIRPDYVGIETSRAILNVINTYLRLNIELKELDKEIKQWKRGNDAKENAEKQLLNMMVTRKKDELRYIG